MKQKQQLFILEYAIDLNATAAAIRAGYSKKTAYSQGQRLLKNVEISQEIKRQIDERGRRLGIDADSVLQELARIAFFDIRKMFYSDGRLIPIHLLDRNTAAAIAGFKIHESTLDAQILHETRVRGQMEGALALARGLGAFSHEEWLIVKTWPKRALGKQR
jgi:phage terminase small subunit